MKTATRTNLTTVLTMITEKPRTTVSIAAETGMSMNLVLGLMGTFSGPTAEVPVLWTRKSAGGHDFLVVTEAGKSWAKGGAMSEEEALALLF